MDIRFNLYHISAGTLNSSALFKRSHSKEVGMSCGDAFLGPAIVQTIGRALSLCMINIGWSFQNRGGMIGQPTRYTQLIFAKTGGSPESLPLTTGSVGRQHSHFDECIWYDRLRQDV